MKHIFSNKVEFYITNVCNLTCNNCNRFNNHNFRGWQNWAEYQPVYQQWSQYIDLPNIVIMGGEPLLNPTVTDWIRGLNTIFGSHIQVLTNGLQLAKVTGLYDALLDHQGHIGISLHNTNHFDQIRSNIQSFLGNIVDEYGPAINQDRHDGIYYSARDSENMLVNVYLSNNFTTAAIIPKLDGTFGLHNSDAEQAHSQCGFAQYKCYHFIRGKIYKCGPVALLPEFDQQFHLAISNQERELLHSYQPMTVESWPQQGQQWIEKLDSAIPQCTFCPSNFDIQTIFPEIKSKSLNKV